jgi:hypothetical protein
MDFVSWGTYGASHVRSIPLYGTSILLLTKGPRGTPNRGKKGKREATILSLVPCWPGGLGARFGCKGVAGSVPGQAPRSMRRAIRAV